MIVKHIPALPSGRNAGWDRASHARMLIDYMHMPDKESPYRDDLVAYMVSEKLPDMDTERLIHIGARGFVSDTLEGQRAEMMAVAQAAVRSPNPIDHWLISWREGEIPTRLQIDETVRMFVEHLGVADHQVIYACHGDTHNRHLHIALNRYDPLQRRTVEINKGFTHEAAHQAIALIVDRFGWEAEKDARYVVEDGKAVLSGRARRGKEDGDRPIKPAAAAFEVRTGYRSAQRIAQEEALPIVLGAKAWASLHAELAAKGMAYDPVGTNGALLTVNGERLKASTVHGRITVGALEKRLGQFQPRDPSVLIAGRSEEKDRFPEAFRADEYRAECDAWKKYQESRKTGAAASASRPAPSTTMEALRDEARARASVQKPKPRRPAPDLESWYYDRGEIGFARQWRHRSKKEQVRSLVGMAVHGAELPAAFDGYQRYPCAEGYRYAREGEGTAFIVRPDRIDLVPGSDEALLAALRLAAMQFNGRIRVKGNSEFLDRAFRIAEANGLGGMITNPELADWRAARHKVEAASVPAPLPERPKRGLFAQAADVDRSAGHAAATGPSRSDAAAHTPSKGPPPERVSGKGLAAQAASLPGKPVIRAKGPKVQDAPDLHWPKDRGRGR